MLTWEGIEPVVELVIQLLRTAIVVLFCVEILLRIVGAGRRIVRKKQEIIEMCLVNCFLSQCVCVCLQC